MEATEAKVAKFGGSSLADASQFEKVRAIVLSDPERRYVVPSAPGMRHAGDRKITDMLYACQRLAAAEEPFEELFDEIAQRYIRIAEELRLGVDIRGALEEVRRALGAGCDSNFAASRGEYLCGLLLADYLSCPFVDAARGILFDANGALDSERTQDELSALLEQYPRAVIPAFTAPRLTAACAPSPAEAATSPGRSWPGRCTPRSTKTGPTCPAA